MSEDADGHGRTDKSGQKLSADAATSNAWDTNANTSKSGKWEAGQPNGSVTTATEHSTRQATSISTETAATSATSAKSNRLIPDGGGKVERKVEEFEGTLVTVDGSGTDILHLSMKCPHIDEQLLHTDYEVNSRGPRYVDVEDFSEQSLRRSSVCGTCERLFLDGVNSHDE